MLSFFHTGAEIKKKREENELWKVENCLQENPNILKFT